jgi:hypothetical protein
MTQANEQMTSSEIEVAIEKFLSDRSITFDFMGGDFVAEPSDIKGGKPWEHYRYEVKFYRGDGPVVRYLSSPWKQGTAISDDPNPTAVLWSLTLDLADEDTTFEEWCANYGYDEDSRRAEKLFLTCKEQSANVRRFFTASEIAELQTVLADY